MKIIIGIGNPGKEYTDTRHNVGFKVVDEIASRFNIKLKRYKFDSYGAISDIEGYKMLLLRPITYVNKTGDVVVKLRELYSDLVDKLLIICDDINLHLGTIRIRRKGSSGSHKGLQSIIDALGCHEFARLRIGIGRPFDQDPKEYVLSRFFQHELSKVSEMIKVAADATIVWLTKGIEECMNIYNKKGIAGYGKGL
jgi:PTH1 family peptidyl-tRNA hydrolase